MEYSNINQKYTFEGWPRLCPSFATKGEWYWICNSPINLSAIIPFKANLFMWFGVLLFPDQFVQKIKYHQDAAWKVSHFAIRN